MKSIKESLNEQQINKSHLDSLSKHMEENMVPKKIIDIINYAKPNDGNVNIDTLVDILCAIYNDKYNN